MRSNPEYTVIVRGESDLPQDTQEILQSNGYRVVLLSQTDLGDPFVLQKVEMHRGYSAGVRGFNFAEFAGLGHTFLTPYDSIAASNLHALQGIITSAVSNNTPLGTLIVSRENLQIQAHDGMYTIIQPSQVHNIHIHIQNLRTSVATALRRLNGRRQ